MPIKMDAAQQAIAKSLFAPAVDRQEGKTRLTVRFDPETLTLYHPPRPGKRDYKREYKGLLLLHYVVDETAKTPTGGRFTRRALTVRSADGRRWVGNMRKDSDVIRLRLLPEGG